jgi:arginase
MAPRRARVLVVPYDSGQRNFRMGAGPSALIKQGLPSRIQQVGFDVTVEEIHPSGNPPHPEIATAFGLARTISERVRAADEAGDFPLVLSGNCNTSLGTVSGLQRTSRGVVWFDAHGDFNTPETTIGGFLDGMALAALTGRCWNALTRTIPHFEAVPDDNVIQLGARSYDPAEIAMLEASGIGRAGADAPTRDVDELLDRLSSRVNGVYLHLDLDVVDSGEGRANTYACAGGYTRAALNAMLDRIAQRIPVKAMAVTAYDPDADPESSVAEAAIEFVETVLRNKRKDVRRADGQTADRNS